jgi:hypothetical protein
MEKLERLERDHFLNIEHTKVVCSLKNFFKPMG